MLREVRDNVILETESGSAFMQRFNQAYYAFSPAIADMQRQNDTFNDVVRVLITPLLATLSVMELADVDSEFEVVLMGGSVLMLNLSMYAGIPVLAGFVIHKCKSKA